jgi:hypothetical protein
MGFGFFGTILNILRITGIRTKKETNNKENRRNSAM